MDKSSALEKIKKCLALSRSANEHEAAQALKHAQALMAKYGLTGWDVELAEVSEQYGKAPKSAPSWHWRLVHLCGSAFGCDRWHAADRSGGRFVFCGINGVCLRSAAAPTQNRTQGIHQNCLIARAECPQQNRPCRLVLCGLGVPSCRYRTGICPNQSRKRIAGTLPYRKIRRIRQSQNAGCEGQNRRIRLLGGAGCRRRSAAGYAIGTD